MLAVYRAAWQSCRWWAMRAVFLKGLAGKLRKGRTFQNKNANPVARQTEKKHRSVLNPTRDNFICLRYRTSGAVAMIDTCARNPRAVR